MGTAFRISISESQEKFVRNRSRLNRQHVIRLSVVSASAALAAFNVATTAQAQIIGFGGTGSTTAQNGSWTLNADSASSVQGTPSISGSGTLFDVLTMTTANSSEASSAWYNTPQNVSNFIESFTYTDVSGNGADGLGVVWQNSPGGLSALGGPGGELGFSNLTSTAGLAMNLYSGNTTSSTGYNANIPGSNNPLVVPTPGGNTLNTSINRVNIDSGDPINVELSYVDATGTLTEYMADATTGFSFSRVWRGISIVNAVGGSTAYIGFTGATGGVTAKQTITKFAFVSGAATPAPAMITPIATSGYNQNMIISATAGTVNMTATMDQGTGLTSNAFYEIGADSVAPVLGVPKGGVVFGSETDPNHSFMLQPNGPGQMDAVMLDSGHTSGALAFTGVPTTYSLLSFLVSGANGGGAVNVTIEYANGTTQSTTITAPDWFTADGASPDEVAWYADGRASVGNAAADSFSFNDNNNTPNQQPVMLEEDVTLSDTTDAVTGVQFSYPGANRVAIWGVSGAVLAQVPEPVGLTALLLGTCGLLARRRRCVP